MNTRWLIIALFLILSFSSITAQRYSAQGPEDRDIRIIYGLLNEFMPTTAYEVTDSLLVLHDSAATIVFDTYWDDLRFPASQMTKGVANPPDDEVFRDSLYAYAFNKNTDEDVQLIVQMPHGWKEGTAIRPHIHTSVNEVLADSMVWAIQYSIADINGSFGESTEDIAIDTVAGQYKHHLTDFAEIDMTGKTLSSIIMIRLRRDANNASDDTDGDVFLLEFDIHYQIDRPGSREETVK